MYLNQQGLSTLNVIDILRANGRYDPIGQLEEDVSIYQKTKKLNKNY